MREGPSTPKISQHPTSGFEASNLLLHMRLLLLDLGLRNPKVFPI